MKRVHESRSDESDVIGAGAPESEFEITSAMIEAGADIIWRRFDDVLAYGSSTGLTVATEVYQAMRGALPKRSSITSNRGGER